MASSLHRTRSQSKKTQAAGSGPRRTPRRKTPQRQQPGTNSGLTTADNNNAETRTPGKAKTASSTSTKKKKSAAATANVPASAPPATPSSASKSRGPYVKSEDFDLATAYALCDPEARVLTFAKAYKLDNRRHGGMKVDPEKYNRKARAWDAQRTKPTHLDRARLMVEADLREKASANEPLNRMEKIVAAALGGEAKFGFGAAPAAISERKVELAEKKEERKKKSSEMKYAIKMRESIKEEKKDWYKMHNEGTITKDQLDDELAQLNAKLKSLDV